MVGTTSLNQLRLDGPDSTLHGGTTLSLGDGRWARVMASMTGTPTPDWALSESRGEAANEVYIGGGQSDVWCAVFADCTGAEFVIPSGSEFGAKGTALLAGVGIGEDDDIESAARRTPSAEQSHSPYPNHTARSDERYDWDEMTDETVGDVRRRRSETLDSFRTRQP